MASEVSEASVVSRLNGVLQEIKAAAGRCGRHPADITLIAVSKTFAADAIRPVLEAGQRVFGENRVQEATDKWPALRAEYEDLVLHLIGPLQTNKVRQAVALFDVIHSVDRLKLAQALKDECERQGRSVRCLVQVNTGAEPQKSGILPDQLDDFIGQCRDRIGLEIAGGMCLPPVNENPALHFALLEKLARRNGLSELSMGMSHDFETAIELGASMVRIGSAIFGPRDE